ncbi:PHP domain-containing protein [Planktomarina temperata]|nr:PHP domain-containing protein [Planktomarina temperata]
MKIEFHCHSRYSFDCSTDINSIILSCLNRDVKIICISDHDVFGLSQFELSNFELNGIKLLPAIEFTTSEGIHIIGISDEIKSIQRPKYHYSAMQLISVLLNIDAHIIIPHPYHKTGLIGNGRLLNSDINDCLEKAHFLEKNNRRYGRIISENFLVKKFSNLKEIVASDAHYAKDIGLFLSITDGLDHNDLKEMSTHSILNHIYENNLFLETHHEKSEFYFKFKKLKSNKIYQIALQIIPYWLRLKIKLFLRLN